jgi:ligand-binding sensor domain-containing protein/signal transduction histidine kinase
MFGISAPSLQSFSARKWAYPVRALVRLTQREYWLPGLVSVILFSFTTSTNAIILWNDPDTTVVHENGAGSDILGGAVKRDDSANDSFYFKFHVDPQSDKDTEEYFAAFELFEGNSERMGVGNALKAWAYSAFFRTSDTADSNSIASYVDLRSAKPEIPGGRSSGAYQYPRRGTGATIVFKIQYIPGEDDLITVWLDPDLGPGANEASQAENLTTRFNANGSFDEIRLRHGGRGGGWAFSDLAIATSFNDFVDFSGSRPSEPTFDLASGARALNFQSWQQEQGLMHSPVRALTQTRDGYLWVGTDNGVARFDGLRFTGFGAADGIKNAPVTTLLQDHRGALWLGTRDRGLSCWNNDRFTNLTTADGLPANSITALVEDNAGRVWIGTEAGLFLWEMDHLSASSAAGQFNGARINALFKDQTGTIWTSVKNAGVYQFTNEDFAPVTDDSLEGALKESHCLMVDHAGRLWLGTGENLVLCRDGNRWYQFKIPRHEAKSHITSLAEEPDGTVWAGSSGGGLLRFKDGKFVAIPAGTGLAGNLIHSLLTDREGHLWVGTESGLNRLHRKVLTTLSQAEGLGTGAARSVAEVTPGLLWVSKANGGLYRWDGKNFNRLSLAGVSPHDAEINTVLVTRDRRCWVATTNSLLLYKDPVAAADEVGIVNWAKLNIVALAEDGQGVLWAGTREGTIWQLREGNWLQKTNFAAHSSITGIVPIADDSAWVGTEQDGLFRVGEGNVESVDRDRLLSKHVRTLFLDSSGTLWVGTADAGLGRFRNGRFVNFTTRERLPDNSIAQILEDDSSRLWLGTAGGIACVSKTQFENVAAGKASRLYPQLFHRAERMLSEECGSGFFPAGLKTQSGLLWFPTSKGISVINPRFHPVETAVPNAVLEEVIVDDASSFPVREPNSVNANHVATNKSFADSANLLRIHPGKHRVEFRFTGLSFDAPELIRFRYRLEGVDPDWVEAGTRRSAFYNYLPADTYRFHVAACNSDGVWSESESNFHVVIRRHYWQTWWFITAVVVSAATTIIATVHFAEKRRLHRHLKRVEQERALEYERTRIAKDLHDEMGAKLCRISFLSEHASRDQIPASELREQITSISDTSRDLLHSLDEIVWAVNPQNDTLEHVASYIGQYAQEYFQMTGIECELNIPTQVPAHPLSSQMRHHLFLAAHEAFTNILKHSNASRADVSMVLSNTAFEIKISDNGKGLSPGLINSNGDSFASALGNGLSNMRKRLTDIGGFCAIDSTPDQGTNVNFVIPLNSFSNGKQ